jgi:ubiquinone/menaquinone biosynthesis C-methylase UbiE
LRSRTLVWVTLPQRIFWSGAIVKTDWRSYDGIAETYARVAHQQCFALPARDLVSALYLTPGSRVLDVGAGTGVVAKLAADIVGVSGAVVAVDPAIGMVCHLGQRRSLHAVVAELPRLPLRDNSFDAVAAAFVLTHLGDPAEALAAMASALRPNGRLAVSSWAASESSSPPGRTWQALAAEYAGDETLAAAVREALPSQDEFADPAVLARALEAAGLERVLARTVSYPIAMTTPDFAALRSISTAGRFVASVLPAGEWARFKLEAVSRLTVAHGAQLRFDMRANIVAGLKSNLL